MDRGATGVVEEPPVFTWIWWPLPRYNVVHNYIVDNQRVVIRDKQYSPMYARMHPYLHNDVGPDAGWFRNIR